MSPNTCYNTTFPQTILKVWACEKQKVLSVKVLDLALIVNKTTNPRFALWSLGNIFSTGKINSATVSVSISLNNGFLFNVRQT